MLAVFLPIISDMSGCSGNQAVAVSIRELTMGLVRPRELLRVLTKESAIGVVNGIVLGIMLGGAAILWKGNPYLGLVVGVSLAANTLVAVSLGGLIPLILRGCDPIRALASGPLLRRNGHVRVFLCLKLCLDDSSQADRIGNGPFSITTSAMTITECIATQLRMASNDTTVI